MIVIRRSEERGAAEHGWLQSQHTFSFADYYDPAHMGFCSLRVINEDRVAPGRGFDTHPHKNMEILSYVVSGELAHRDSMGNQRNLKSGELQAMSAGSGILHSEFNPSASAPVHFLQIWITPEEKNLLPSYAEWKLQEQYKSNSLTLMASKTAIDNSVKINQDVSVYLGRFKAGEAYNYNISSGRKLWMQIISGEIDLDNNHLFAGDGVAIEKQPELRWKSRTDSNFLLFDLV